MSFEQVLEHIAQTSLGALNQRDERRAALLLHALEPEDQDWLLNALPVQVRARLGELLQELAQLGITPDRDMADEVIRSNAQELAAPGVDLYRLSQRQAEAVINVLIQESNAIIGAVLRIADWPWKPDLLKRLGGTRSQMVLRHLAEKPNETLPQGVRQSLLRNLSGVVAEASSADDLPSPSFSSVARDFIRGLATGRKRVS